MTVDFLYKNCKFPFYSFMKTATVSEIRKELQHNSQSDLLEICLRLSKFKKENKELLSYLLFESHDEEAYIGKVKGLISEEFTGINTSSYYYIKKSVRKILRITRKFIRYSNEKETEISLLLHYLNELKKMRPSYKNNPALVNLFDRQLTAINKAISALHEDLRLDYQDELDELCD